MQCLQKYGTVMVEMVESIYSLYNSNYKKKQTKHKKWLTKFQDNSQQSQVDFTVCN